MFQKIICCLISCCLLPFAKVQAQEISLPAPGTMVHLSAALNPPILKGIKVHTDDPFKFDFILGNVETRFIASNQDEPKKLIKYFLAALTTPEKDMWVNLSPYEKDRIVPESFGTTEMGRDLLAQDYILKQITASLVYPEGDIGRTFWKKIYAASPNKNIPINTFNKVWIVPNKAVVYENVKNGTAYVVESSLKVMTEQDYLADTKNNNTSNNNNIVRDVVIPQLTKEVNEGSNFAQLRQVYNSLILATWYKKKIKDSILSQVYADKNKVSGVNIENPQEKQKIYDRYLEAFKKGAYNYIKEEQDPLTQQLVPRKYFSGGVTLDVSRAMSSTLVTPLQEKGLIEISLYISKLSPNGSIETKSLNNEKIIDPKALVFDPRLETLSINGSNATPIGYGHYHLVYSYKNFAVRISKNPLFNDSNLEDNEKNKLINVKGVTPELYQQGFITSNDGLHHFAIVERVEGDSLDKINVKAKSKFTKNEATRMIYELLKKMILSKLYLLDFKNEQFKLGQLANTADALPQAWMVDADELYYFVGNSLKDLVDVYLKQIEEKPFNNEVVDNQLLKEKLITFKKSLDHAQVIKVIEESLLDFDPNAGRLFINQGKDELDRVGHIGNNNYIFVYNGYIIRVNKYPEGIRVFPSGKEQKEAFEKRAEQGIAPVLYQSGILKYEDYNFPFHVVDRIEGYSFEEMPVNANFDSSKEERTALFIDLFRKMLSTMTYMSDIKPSQFMIGYQAHDVSKKVKAWLVDAESLKNDFPGTRKDLAEFYINKIRSNSEFIVAYEKIFDMGKVLKFLQEQKYQDNSMPHRFIDTNAGGRIHYSISQKEFEQIIKDHNGFFIQGGNETTHLQQGKKLWVEDDKDLRFFESILGLTKRIKDLKTRYPNKKMIVLDWGCGAGTAIIELRKVLLEQGVEVDVYGLSHDYYPEWQLAPQGVNFILDSGENLPHYFGKDSVGIIFSANGISHQLTTVDQFRRGKIENIQGYFRQLIDMLLPGGSILINNHNYWKETDKYRNPGIELVLKRAQYDRYYSEYQKDSAMASTIKLRRVNIKEPRALLQESTFLNSAVAKVIIKLEKASLDEVRDRLSFLRQKAEILEDLESILQSVEPIKLKSIKTFMEYREYLKELRAVRVEIYRQIVEANQKNDIKALQELNIQAVFNNMRITKVQLMLAASFLSDTGASRNTGAALASLQGVRYSLNKLQSELIMRIERLYAARVMKDYNTYNPFTKFVFNQTVDVSPVENKEQRWVIVSNQLEEIYQILIDKETPRPKRMKQATGILNELIQTFQRNFFRMTTQSTKIEADLRDIMGFIMAIKVFNNTQISKLRQKINDLREYLKSNPVYDNVRVSRVIPYKDIETYFRHFSHEFEQYQNELVILMKRKALLKYFSSRANILLYSDEESKIERIQIIQELNMIVEWLEKGVVNQKRLAKDQIAAAVEVFIKEKSNPTLMQALINDAVDQLERRIYEVKRIVAAHHKTFQKDYKLYLEAKDPQLDLDFAMGVNKTPGGIDLNANKINLNIKAADGGIHFKTSSEMFERFKDASGFTPVIINIQPLNNLAAFLNA